ncbi:AMP-binding protein, partial [bacterium]|nr:AMP-binding protein [bacterium]
MIHIKTLQDYEQSFTECQNDPAKFWQKIASGFEWMKAPQKTMEGSFEEGNVTWFADGQLNITVNALDRHVGKNPDRIAFYFKANNPEEATQNFTYQQTLDKVCQFANLLKSRGVKKGDVVCFYMSMVPELLFGVLACARIGAI